MTAATRAHDEQQNAASWNWLTRSATEDDDLEWRQDAVCAQTDPEAFFPEKGGSTKEAKKVCRSCEVRQECLEYALANDERFGIWGGLSARERAALRKRRRHDASPTELQEGTRP